MACNGLPILISLRNGVQLLRDVLILAALLQRCITHARLTNHTMLYGCSDGSCAANRSRPRPWDAVHAALVRSRRSPLACKKQFMAHRPSNSILWAIAMGGYSHSKKTLWSGSRQPASCAAHVLIFALTHSQSAWTGHRIWGKTLPRTLGRGRTACECLAGGFIHIPANAGYAENHSAPPTHRCQGARLRKIRRTWPPRAALPV